MSEQRLRITEIFHSLQGETRTVGLPTAFIRLTGCPLRCTYCDTAYAFKGGNWYSLDDIIAKIAEYNVEYVTVTGGEPLAQPDCIPLLKRLCDLGYQVSLETSGALDVKEVDSRVMKVVDLKTPDSNESDKNLYSNIDYLTKHDAVKFVICSRSDYEWARAISEKYTLADRCEVLFSPSYQQQSLKDLAEWILEDKLKARMQVQLHKYIWGDIPGV
jgi:7-carboxy-7-deazaguanine synthase